MYDYDVIKCEFRNTYKKMVEISDMMDNRRPCTRFSNLTDWVVYLTYILLPFSWIFQRSCEVLNNEIWLYLLILDIDLAFLNFRRQHKTLNRVTY